ncbi:unnamed protein product [Phytomonas sp. EM1]|nr:unnamed protein product [Phytomonas sp. EM1]|eukprot:CCW62372.1 unnamed protein product [Phytomonas sp. isolate EM1]
MSHKLSLSIAYFLKNIIELGVCENCSCANAYQGLTTELQKRILDFHYAEELQNLPIPSLVLTSPLRGSSGTLVHIEGTAPAFCDAARCLVSTVQQMSLSLADYVDTIFTVISVNYGATIDILLRSLCLVEKVQKANLCAFHHSLEHQLGSTAVSNTNSLAIGCAQVSTLQEPSPFLVDELYYSQKDVSSVPSAHIHVDTAFPMGYSNPLSKIECASNITVDSKASSPCVTAKCSTSSEVSLLTATSCPSEKPQCNELLATTVLEPFSQIPHSLCSLCRNGNVFSLQYHNIHTFLAASLLLNLKIGAAVPLNKTASDTIAADVARVCGCEVSQLLVAEWLICAALNCNITVSTHELEGIVRRLGIVEVIE